MICPVFLGFRYAPVVVKYLSERILVMLDGKIVESGDTISTLQNPKKEYTKKLMSAVYEI